MTVHLFTRSAYSLMDSTIDIEKLVHKAKSEGYRAVGLCDHNVMTALPFFKTCCETVGIHPIFGMEVDVLYHDATIAFLLLAMDNRGYENLMHLSTTIQSEERPCTLDELNRYSDHNVLIAYGEGGWMDSELIEENREAIRSKLQIMKEELPPFYMAISYQDSSLWKIKNQILKQLCRTMDIQTTALHKVYYLEAADAQSYRVLRGIKQSKTVMDQTLPLIQGRYFLSMQEMSSLYDSDDLEMTEHIASLCRCDLNIEKTDLPQFEVPEQVTAEQYLTQLCLAGLQRRPLVRDKQVYLKRLQYELSVITKMHFENYFLIVWDFIRYAKKQGIYVGPGRGSAAGSLVSYCLGITMIDPLKYNLLFERFLNPERISMPDIDTDFPDNRREEVIRYVHEKYGDSFVGNIAAYGTFGARQVLRDVAKVLNIAGNDVDMLLRMIPANNDKVTLKDALQNNKKLNQIVHAEKKYEQLFAIAIRLEGLPRHMTIHPAGVLISRKPLVDVVPTIKSGEGLRTSQYTKEYLERFGLIKMDFLGVRNLSVIDQIVNQIHLFDPDFKIQQIPLNDESMLNIFRNADTSGIFQFEGNGMKGLLRKLAPTRFEDVVAAQALFRPASLDSVDQYLKNRQNPSDIKYPSEELKPVLEETYGIMIYQEQALQTAQIAGGFSLGRADSLRKAISKKDESLIEGMKKDFFSGCQKNGYDEATTNMLFEWIVNFAGYGFNKSHAVAYTVVACQMAYLKAHYSDLFYCSLLDHVIGDFQKTSSYIEECRRKGIQILSPDVNASSYGYQVDRHAIRIPLSAIKGIGAHNAKAIIDERNKRPYVDFFDFVARANTIRVSKKMIELLIDAGALDCFDLSRATMRTGIDKALEYADLTTIEVNGVKTINPNIVSKPMLVRQKDQSEKNAKAQREVLGFLLGDDPIRALRHKLGIQDPVLADIDHMSGQVYGFAYLQDVRLHRTKKGDMMAFTKISDETAELSLTVMPRLYQRVQGDLRKGRYIRFRGKISDEGNLIADWIDFISEEEA